MKKFAFTTAIALALATTAYAADHNGGGGGRGFSGGGGGGAGLSAQGGGRANFSAPGGAGGPTTMGPSRGAGVYNSAPPTNAYRNNGENYGHFTEGNRPHNGGDYGRFTEGNRHMYNYGGKNFENREGNRFEGGRDHHGVVSGNFFEHGRHFRFRRFFNGEWVFLNAWDDCTAYAWVNVAPGAWAWAPVNVCYG